MSNDLKRRIIAVDPSIRGFGFCVFEGEELLDWGVKHVRAEKNGACVKKLGELLEWYRPRVLVLEDSKVRACRRGARPRLLLQAMGRLARRSRVRVTRISVRTARRRITHDERANKYDMADRLAAAYPALAWSLPRRRKCWMSEDERMSIFEAAGLAVAFLIGSKTSAGHPSGGSVASSATGTPRDAKAAAA